MESNTTAKSAMEVSEDVVQLLIVSFKILTPFLRS
jgi:hypothetical protein